MADQKPSTDNPQKKPDDVLLKSDGSPITVEERNDSEGRFDEKTDATHTAAHNIEPADTPTIAGTDQYGLGAVNTAAQNQRIGELERARMASPQDAENDRDTDNNAYTSHSSAADTLKFNGAESGSLGAGMIAGTIFAELKLDRLEDEQKKERDANYRLVMAGIADSFENVMEMLGDLDNKAEQVEQRINENEIRVNALDKIFQPKIEEMEDVLRQQEKELAELKASGASAELIQDKQLEIDATSGLLRLYKDTQSGLIRDQESAGAKVTEARDKLEKIRQEMSAYKEGDTIPPELQKRLEAAQSELTQAETQVDKVDKRALFAEKMLSASNELHSKIKASTSQCSSSESIKVRATLVDKLITVSADGVLSKEDVAQLREIAKAGNLDEKAVNSFVNDFADSGLDIETEDGKFLNGNDAKDYILSQWKEVQAEKQVVKAEIENLSGEKGSAQAELKALMAQRDKAAAELTQAQNTYNAEVTKADAVRKEAAAASNAMTGYEGVHDYMKANYSLSVMGMSIGKGENIDKVASDPNRFLRDSKNNLVYVSKEDQRMYILEKDEKGNVKLDKEGNQIQRFLTDAESLSLHNKMTQNKLIPRNFAPNDNAVVKETSQHDGWLGTLTAAVTGSDGMSAKQTQINHNRAVAAQDVLKEESSKKLSATQEKIASTKTDMDTKTANLQSLDRQIAAQQSKMTELNKREANLVQANGGKIPGNTVPTATKVAATTSAAATKDTAASSGTTTSGTAGTQDTQKTHALNTPTYTPQQNEDMKRKIDNITAITAEGLVKLKEEAAKVGISPETVDDKLKANKIEVKDNTFAQSDTQPEKPEPVITRTVSFPLIGAQTQTPIIANFTPQSTNGVTAKGFTFGSVLDDYPQYNDPKNPAASYLAPINNKAESAPAASNAFDSALTAQSPAAIAAEAERKRLEQEETLRLAQQQLASRPAATGGGMMGGAGAGAGTGA